MTVALKICGVTNADDLRVCRDAGVGAVGINLWAGSKRHVELADAERMLAEVRREGPVPKIIGIDVDPDPQALLVAAVRLDLFAVQLHGDTPPDRYTALGVPWVRVVRGPVDVAPLPAAMPPPVWVLLDAHVDGFGGQGTRVSWTWAAAAVASLSGTDVWLAGGIDPGCAAEAIAQVRPAGLDVASGAEQDGDPRRKDPAKIAALAAICQKAGA